MLFNKFKMDLQLFAGETLEQLLGDDLYKQVTEKLGDKKIAIVSDGTWIPKSKFDDVNEEKKELKTQLEQRDKQLKDLGDKAKGNEDLEKQIKELQDLNKTTKESYEAKIKDMAINSAIQSKLTDTKYPDLLMTKFDKSKLSVQEDGSIIGIDEQLTAIKEQYKDLFVPKITGGDPYNKGGGPSVVTKDQFNKMGYLDRLKLKQTNSELYEKLIKE